MKSPDHSRVIAVLIAACVLLAFLSCGHTRHAAYHRPTPASISLTDVLRGIDAYPAPQGVNSETWTMLVTELKKQLVARSKDGKTLSVALSGTENKVSDWNATYNAASSTETYEWTQKLSGDYNSDGQVGI